MVKKILLGLLLISVSLQAQKSISIPSSHEFETYLFARQHQILTKLYNAALEGKIKAYKSDSLRSVYDIPALKIRGGDEMALQNGIQLDPFNTKNIKGLLFLKNAWPNPLYKPSADGRLKGMAILFSPMIAGIPLNPQPIFWIDLQDMLNALDQNEHMFLTQLYYYSSNDNCVHLWGDEDSIYDNFWDLNHYGNTYVRPDTPFYRHVSSMLVNSQFYVSSLFIHKPYGSATKVNREFLLTIILDKESSIWYYEGDMEMNLKKTNKTGIRDIIHKKQKTLEAGTYKTKDSLICIIKATDKANYHNIVDILDEMGITGVERYFLQDVDPKEIMVIENEGDISIANYAANPIFDEQLRRHISFTEFQNLYKEKVIAFISTDPGNPAVGNDTTFETPLTLDRISKVTFDASGNISRLNFEISLDKKTLKFYIEPSKIIGFPQIKPIVWFYEDYARWKKY